mmetsp:Transcript_11108/g.16821  ORF Transcript_11108/g.16821 Transcript_11108/m.16821 type:complete len:83 (-) Transcript_11108:14-262(-)
MVTSASYELMRRLSSSIGSDTTSSTRLRREAQALWCVVIESEIVFVITGQGVCNVNNNSRFPSRERRLLFCVIHNTSCYELS